MKTLYSLRDALAAAVNADDQELIRVMGETIPEICGGWPWDSYPAPNPLKSIDTALALVERLLPLAGVELQRITGGTTWWCQLTNQANGDQFEAYDKPTAPLAILKALVAALIAQETTNDQA